MTPLHRGRDMGEVKPVRLQLSRKKGFDLQALSRATNGLEAVNVCRPGPWGNWLKCGDPGELWIAHKYNDGLRVKLTALLLAPVTQALAANNFERWLRHPGWPGDFIPQYRKLADAFQPVVAHVLSAKAQWLYRNLRHLRGHNVACSCALGEPCHGDALLRLSAEWGDRLHG